MVKRESGREVNTKIFYNRYALQQHFVEEVRVMNRISRSREGDDITLTNIKREAP